MAKLQEKSLPRKVISGTSRAGIGGGAILIGIALFLLFRGFGPGGTGLTGSGSGESGGKTMVTTTGDAEVVSTATEKSIAAPDTVQGGLTDDERKALSGDILTVLIDERSFLIELPSRSEPVFRPASLERIVELAALARGDTNGIKIRILRRQTSRASSEQELMLELKHIGIRRDAIIMPEEFVP